MPRLPGSKNRDHDATRSALARRFASALFDVGGESATLHGLAKAAGVSVPTVRHYFQDRDGAFRAALEAVREDGAQRLREMADPGHRSAEECLVGLVRAVTVVWRRFGLGQTMVAGLALGVGSASRGPAYLEELLEPFLQAAEQLLTALVDRGRMKPLDARAVALALLTPVLFALIHQDHLGGSRQRPLDVIAFATSHAALVLRGLGELPAPARRDGSPRTSARRR